LPPPPFLVRYGLHCCDRVLKLCDPLESAVRWHRVVLSCFHDEVALAGLEAVQESVEPVHGAV
jgi:hypothetical protein